MLTELPRGKADAVIVGGGIIGCSAAYFAAKAGLEVVLVDKGAVGFEQSTRNWGWIHQQVRHPHLIPFSMYSRRIWEGLEAELGADLEWRQGGNINLAGNQPDMEAFEGYLAAAGPSALDVELLGPAETQKMLPGIGNDVLGSLHVGSDGQANPRLVTRAFADAARGLGVTIVENCAVNSMLTSGNRTTGVATERGAIEAEQVVIACGAWSRRMLKPLGIKLPQNAIRSTVIRTTPASKYTQATGWAGDVAFRQDARGKFVLAAGNRSTFDVNLDSITDLLSFGKTAWHYRSQLKVGVGKVLLRDVFTLLPGTAHHAAPWAQLRNNEPPPDLGAAAPNLDGFHRLLPQFSHLAVEEIWAGNVDMTPDQAPVLDNATGVKGLVIATGFSGHGFALGPGGGQTTAALLQGMTPEVDIHGFRLARFAEGNVPELVPFHPVRETRR
ncbi:MAG: FAD-binding oxidoreductase [Pseudomonadales bacterium]|jgi:glycine/D-amino acid oxidase-like deaminating enzyme|nr:FAD-binding oxidoreductase [Pseudomonadales bacterium]MDP6826619.1 FAD-binding oxidoreductase [Pseudomonadales bacterium]MDP6970110.1 FAD-binding oxidoreductase [Pseudomonadales bacterium]|tara:strand:+ start:513 stop:1838 length:1326 start_codon:yes stop_codon:yes gene_type:complete